MRTLKKLNINKHTVALTIALSVAFLFCYNTARAQVVPAQNQIIPSAYFGQGYLISTSTSPTHKLGASLIDLAGSFITGILGVSHGGTGVSSITGLVKGNGTSPFSAAIAGTDYVANVTGDWTGTFDGQEGSYYLANSFSTTSANYWLTQKSTSDLAEGTNLYYTDARVNAYIHASTTIPKAYTANTFTALQQFSAGASTTQLTTTGTTYLATTGGNVGIGITSPSYKLEVNGSASTTALYLPNSASATVGTINIGGNRFIHNFNYGNNGTVTTSGNNTFIGKNSGNYTTGSTATQTYEASNNTAVGYATLPVNTTGYSNAALGATALNANTTGYYNVAVGPSALINNTSGSTNIGIGGAALANNTTGAGNVGIGYGALLNISTTSGNTALGYQAARYIADDSTANQYTANSTYIGYNTKASAVGVTNENVFGYNATGNGSNSVTLGNSSITKTILQGNVGIGTTTPFAKLSVMNTLGGSGALFLVGSSTSGAGTTVS